MEKLEKADRAVEDDRGLHAICDTHCCLSHVCLLSVAVLVVELLVLDHTFDSFWFLSECLVCVTLGLFSYCSY